MGRFGDVGPGFYFGCCLKVDFKGEKSILINSQHIGGVLITFNTFIINFKLLSSLCI